MAPMNSIQHLHRWGDAHHPRYLDLLRMLLGVFLCLKGIEFATPSNYLTEVLASHLPFSGFLLIILQHYIIFAHIAGGFMIATGLLTRLAALIQIPILLGALVFANWGMTAHFGNFIIALVTDFFEGPPENILLSTVRFFKIKGYGVLQPTYRKMYPIGARLMNEVWIPSSWKPGQSLPLYIDIHGGGFALGDPFHDDGWCNYLASKQNICVVSCDYRKSPGYYFPTQTNDLVEVITSILADETLPVDKSKICIGGFSAGGNLSLSVVQDKQLQGKIKGLCLWYPSTDFSGKYKGIMRDGPDGSPDVLAKSGELFTYGYVPHGVSTTNPLLSPIYADRSILPNKKV
ncbi:MAG: DoxX family membrane protein [Cytophagaceae bacterium]|nr:MAG: DoxX family membrane protein [Cytophagaceae bacterium]